MIVVTALVDMLLLAKNAGLDHRGSVPVESNSRSRS
jgi:hypothetical protein